MSARPAAPWVVYVLVASGGERTYVGVTTDLDRRLGQHNGDLPGGARATRAGRPWRVGASYGPYASRGEAQRIEHALKRRRGAARLRVDLGELAPAVAVAVAVADPTGES